ncbi:MAG: hypothetical protein U0694_07400 [Anaerolineae bacterium]
MDVIKIVSIGSLTPLPSITATTTPSPTLTLTATETSTPTATYSPTNTLTPTLTPTPTPTPTYTPSITPSPTFTFTPSITPTPTLTLTPTPTAPPQATFAYEGAVLSIDSIQVTSGITYATAEAYCSGRSALLPDLTQWTAAVTAGAISSSTRLWEWTSTTSTPGSHEVGVLENGTPSSTSIPDDGGNTLIAEFLGFRCVTP